HGTLTCFFVSLLSLFYIENFLHRFIMSLSICLLELFGGTLDNLFMCIPVVIYAIFFHK
ncbi:conserved membrane protein, unknown function, partial [Hepatocystis sp. ex Piliocolobus tephrosceles]